MSNTSPPLPNANSAGADAAQRLQGRLMADSLGRLLNQARGSREVLPHLAALERSLLQRGASAVAHVPPHWLGRICSQLSSLPLPEQDAPLHDLLGRLMKRLEAQFEDDGHARAGFDPHRTVVVREISHTEFDAVQAEQAGTDRAPRL